VRLRASTLKDCNTASQRVRKNASWQWVGPGPPGGNATEAEAVPHGRTTRGAGGGGATRRSRPPATMMLSRGFALPPVARAALRPLALVKRLKSGARHRPFPAECVVSLLFQCLRLHDRAHAAAMALVSSSLATVKFFFTYRSCVGYSEPLRSGVLVSEFTPFPPRYAPDKVKGHPSKSARPQYHRPRR